MLKYKGYHHLWKFFIDVINLDDFKLETVGDP